MILTWFTSRMEVTSTELCFIIAQGKVKHSSATPHMQLRSSLLDLFSLLYFSPTIYSSLSVDPCGSLHTYSISQLLVTVRLLPLITEPELGFYNSLRVCKTLQLTKWLASSFTQNQPTNPFTIQNIFLYRQPEGLAITTLWACPNSNPKPN